MNLLRKSILVAVTISFGSGFCVTAQADDTQLIEVNLESAGSLGVEVLYKVNVLDDVTDLKVTGPLNDRDWTTLSNMKKLVNVDLSGATAANIPAKTFQGRSSLTTFIAPVGITSIGEYAFSASGLKEITIPESVRSLGQYTFYNCDNMERAVINSSASLPYQAFNSCDRLVEVKITGDVSSIGERCFYSCDALKTINFPETLSEIGQYAFSYDKALTDVVFPTDLREIAYASFHATGLKSATLPYGVELGGEAFASCDSLTEVTLPGTKFSYTNQFHGCRAIKKITSPAGTPPAMQNSYDPFNSSSKGGITLVVPSFSVVNYKLDSYWTQFGTITEGAESDRWAINDELAMTNNRRFEGQPSLDIYSSGKLTVGGAAPMALNHITFRHSRSETYGYDLLFAQLINNCPSMTAETATIELNCINGQWYYLSMPCDISMENVRHSAGSDFVFRSYDGESRATNGTGSSWKDVPADGVLEAGKGYIYQCYSTGSIMLTVDKDEAAALLASGDRATSVNAWKAENLANAGWNLVGNPYMSYYNLSESTLSCPVTVWDGSRRIYAAYSLIDDVVILSPMQAFFIQQTDEDGEVAFGSEGRTFTKEISAAAMRPSLTAAKGSRRIFDVTIGNNSSSWNDRTRVVINPDAILEYESRCDASKFFADDLGQSALYTIDCDGNRLAINERPLDDGVVRLGVSVPVAGTYSIASSRAEGSITLFDSLTGQQTDLSTGASYEFTVDEGGNIEQRFTLVVSDAGVSGIESVSDSHPALRVSTDSSEITVEGRLGNKVTVCSPDGRIVAEGVITPDGCRFKVSEGMYIVSCGDSAVKCVVK